EQLLKVANVNRFEASAWGARVQWNSIGRNTRKFRCCNISRIKSSTQSKHAIWVIPVKARVANASTARLRRSRAIRDGKLYTHGKNAQGTPLRIRDHRIH